MSLQQHNLSEAKIAEIVDLYVREKVSFYMIGSQFRLSSKIIRSILSSQNVLFRPSRGPFSQIELDEVRRLYVEEQMGSTKIARRFDSSGQIINKYLRKMGVIIDQANLFTEQEKQEVADAYDAMEGESADLIRELCSKYKCSGFPIRQIIKSRCEIKNWDKTMQARNRGAKYVHMPRQVYEAKKRGAIVHEIEWTIDIYDIERCFANQNGKCYYTGLPLVTATRQSVYRKLVSNNPRAMSIDRIDSNKGYLPDNIALCCLFVNYAKNAWSEQTFKEVLREMVISMSATA